MDFNVSKFNDKNVMTIVLRKIRNQKDCVFQN